jgi:hypothetical protein
MNFEQWLAESRSVKLSILDFTKRVKKDCSEYLDLIKRDLKPIYSKGYKGFANTVEMYKFLKEIANSFILFRGVASKYDYFYVDPSKLIRKTLTGMIGAEFYTNLIDTNSRWSKYPKRSKSLILSNNYIYAQNYGLIHFCFPTNGSQFGVCPKEDIFESWLNVADGPLPIYISNFINDLIWEDFVSADKEIKKLLKDIDNDNEILTLETLAFLIQKLHDNDLLKNYSDYDFIEKIDPQQNIYNQLEDIFSPEANGFKLIGVKDLKNYRNGENEFWTSNPCYFLRFKDNDAVDIIKELFTL